MEKWVVKDSCGQPVGFFKSWTAAEEFKQTMGRSDWQAVLNPSTEKQRRTVRWIARVTGIPFKHDINSCSDCGVFIRQHIEEARRIKS